MSQNNECSRVLISSSDEVLARRVAGETLADLRTVRKALLGLPVRGIIGQRVKAKIAELCGDTK